MLSNFMPSGETLPFPADHRAVPLVLDLNLDKLSPDHIGAIECFVDDGLLTMVCKGGDRLISYHELATVIGGSIGLDDAHSASCLPRAAHLTERLMLYPVRL